MAVNHEEYLKIKNELEAVQVSIIAVSKTKPVNDILQLVELQQLHFGENYVQELISKATQLPHKINWHFIGHLQSNKVKNILPIVQLIHSVDSLKLLREIEKQSINLNCNTNCLLQIHIAKEVSKFGFNENELNECFSFLQQNPLTKTKITGLMGMASFSNNEIEIRQEFRKLKQIFNQYTSHLPKNVEMKILNMGMSNDYKIAVEEGSNMVRIGSLFFGDRVKP